MQKQFTKERSNIVKGVAIILLLMYHLFENERVITSMEVIYSPISLDDFLMLSGFGNICVAVFVFLTAYGISKGLMAQERFIARSAYEQAWKRFLKLLFHFSFLYISVNLLWGSNFDYASLYGEGKQGIIFLLTDALGMPMFFDAPTLNMTWWYMELAYILIFLLPFLTWLTEKVGYCILPIAFLVPEVVSFHPDTERYLFTAVLGVCAAYGKWPDKWLHLKGNKVLQWILAAGCLILSVPVRQNFVVQEKFEYLIDAPIALLLVYFGGVLLASVPVLGKVLGFIGKHSMNIYLVHSFFYMILWQKFIYQFKYAGITLLLLLVVSLAYSVVLEFIKKLFLKMVDICKNRYYTKGTIR